MSDALRRYSDEPGKAIHSCSKGLEHFFINELNLKGNTLGILIKNYKKHSDYMTHNEKIRKQIDICLYNLKEFRNDVKDSGHPGNKIISISEARFMILSAVNFINFIRMSRKS